MDIGYRLKEVRKDHGLTQQELSEKLHVSRQSISKWETNNSLPDINTLLLLSSIYEMTLQGLLGEDSSIFEQKNVLDNEDKFAILKANDKRRKEEMFTKNAKKFIVGLIGLTVLLLAFNLGREWYYQKQIKRMAITIYGVTNLIYGTEFTLSGADYPILKSIFLEDGTIIENPTIYEIEKLGLTKKKEGKSFDVGPPMIIDYFKKYPLIKE